MELMALTEVCTSSLYHMQTINVRSSVRSVTKGFYTMGLPADRSATTVANGRTDASYRSFDDTTSKNLLPSRRNGQQDKEKSVKTKNLTERQEQFQRAPRSKSFPSAKIQKPKSCCKRDKDEYKDSSPFRKAVHFADSFGLPLTVEISYRKEQEIEVISTCETPELHSKPEGFGLKHKSLYELSDPPKRTEPEVIFTFVQPSSEPDFFARVEKNNVCLENMKRDGPCLQGYVRVTNIAYHKKVSVRLTTDAWRSHQDIECTYSHTFQDSNTDCFTFKLPISGEQLELALQYQVNEQCYWDNNAGRNYKITIKR